MEIDITDFVTYGETWGFSGSIATHGPNAARQTWANALEEAGRAPLLTTEEQLDALRHWAKETGAWDEAEREAWTPQECNALFLQLVTGDLREMGLEDCDPDEFDWAEYQKQASAGQISGNIYAVAGRIFYELA